MDDILQRLTFDVLGDGSNSVAVQVDGFDMVIVEPLEDGRVEVRFPFIDPCVDVVNDYYGNGRGICYRVDTNKLWD